MTTQKSTLPKSEAARVPVDSQEEERMARIEDIIMATTRSYLNFSFGVPEVKAQKRRGRPSRTKDRAKTSKTTKSMGTRTSRDSRSRRR